MHKKQRRVPPSEINIQLMVAAVQPKLSAITAIPYVDIELPIYVHEFKIPETSDTFPVSLKNGGIILISSRLIPCIHPTKSADDKTDVTTLFPETETRTIAERVPIAYMIPDDDTGLCESL